MPSRTGLRLMNDAQPLSADTWAWSVWVDGPAEALDEIASVEYRLHHTFKNPVQVVTNRDTKFRLKATGWGEFTVYAEISKHNGERLRLERWLVFDADSSSGGDRKPRVFISAGAVERPLLTSLRRHLEAQGVEVVSPEHVSPETPWTTSCRETLARVDLAAFVVTRDGLRGFAQEELQMARELNIEIVSVLMGGAALPPDLSTEQALHAADDGDAGTLADALAARARDTVFADDASVQH